MSPGVRPARFPADTPLVRDLFREYADDLGMDLGFQSFEEELAMLPGLYTAPRGGVWIAELDNEPVGCVAVRPIDGDAVCELKRMYVRPGVRGNGLGGEMLDAAIAFARDAGYGEMKLDSDPQLASALHLYVRAGFEPCGRYNDDPHECTLFMRLGL